MNVKTEEIFVPTKILEEKVRRENTAVEVERMKEEMPEAESTLTANKESAERDCTTKGVERQKFEVIDMEAGDTSKEAGEV